MFLGTDDGLYLSLNAGDSWQKWTAGFPTVSTKDLAIHPREQDLIIGTFGRAAWILDDLRPLRALAGNPDLLKSDFELFAPPPAYLAAYQQPTGSRFGADAMYQGENRKSGALLTYYVKEGVSKMGNDDKEIEGDKEENGEESSKASKDSLFLKVFDGDRLIRTLGFKKPKKAGFHKMSWYMDEKGADRPSRTISKSNRERGGNQYFLVPTLWS